MNKLMDETTQELTRVLRGADAEEVRAFLREHFAQGQPTFVQYMDALLEQKQLKRQEVLVRAKLPLKYGYKLLTGESHTTRRDKLLRICFAMELTLKQTQRALKLYGMTELYPKNARDVILMAALGRGEYDLDRIGAELTTAGMEPLYAPGE